MKFDIPVREYLPRVLPVGWNEHEERMDGVTYLHRGRGLYVIVSMAEEQDGCRWVHLSMSQSNRIPTWDELREAKNLFIGRERKVLQVLPAESEYVNIDPRVLHLWWCADKPDLLPDFTRGMKLL